MKVLDLRNSIIDLSISHFESEMIDVTSLHRPDLNWKFIDKAGHKHRWRVLKNDRHKILSCRVIVDAEAWDDYPAITHLECRWCGEHVVPAYKPDESRVYIPGLQRLPDIEISATLEKTDELLTAARSDEKYVIRLDNVAPIIGRVMEVSFNGHTVEAKIRRAN